MKYIFFTGGVVSSLGKGLAAASLGALLEHRGLKVILQKFDPYLNVDPGTMSPYQHGEVYVLDDGAETDLDLGHYERFTSCVLSKLNNLTSGQVYETVIKKERAGDYKGKTVQVIPHVTDEIKNRIHEVADKMGGDVIITEIGGTVGDIEGLPFLEAMRQFAIDVGHENVLFVHVTLVPYIKAAGELKTKPTQQSVAKLREIGIQPQVIIARTEKPLEDDVREKIALFCNLPKEAVIAGEDVDQTIYEVPLKLRKEGLDDIVCDRLGLTAKEPSLTDWEGFVERVVTPGNKQLKIAVVGKYMGLQDAYKSIYEALTHAGADHKCRVLYTNVDSEDIERRGPEVYLSGMDGVLIPGGFGERGIEGKIAAAKYARENKLPYFGLCLGMQIATIEYARNVCGLTDANSTEFEPNLEHPVICLMEEQMEVQDLGATMRLGTYQTNLAEGSRAREIYGTDTITERHRHRYEVNQHYRKQLEDAGLVISGTSPDNTLAEIVELPDHPFYIATQFHPEFLSKPNRAHPLFHAFVGAAVQTHPGRQNGDPD
ncbi:MAG: CTP synthase [Verrucomicrobiales bacterium]|jgi:CTP synthase